MISFIKFLIVLESMQNAVLFWSMIAGFILCIIGFDCAYALMVVPAYIKVLLITGTTLSCVALSIKLILTYKRGEL